MTAKIFKIHKKNHSYTAERLYIGDDDNKGHVFLAANMKDNTYSLCTIDKRNLNEDEKTKNIEFYQPVRIDVFGKEIEDNHIGTPKLKVTDKSYDGYIHNGA